MIKSNKIKENKIKIYNNLFQTIQIGNHILLARGKKIINENEITKQFILLEKKGFIKIRKI